MKFADEFDLLYTEERPEYRHWAEDVRDALHRAIDKYTDEQSDMTPVFNIQAFKPLVGGTDNRCVVC